MSGLARRIVGGSSPINGRRQTSVSSTKHQQYHLWNHTASEYFCSRRNATYDQLGDLPETPAKAEIRERLSKAGPDCRVTARDLEQHTPNSEPPGVLADQQLISLHNADRASG